MIRHVTVRRLNTFINVDQDFHPDINIITGRNGAGKTTLLKLIWYAISGNLERIIPEMSFEYFRVDFDDNFISMECDKKGDDILVSITTNLEHVPELHRVRRIRLMQDGGQLLHKHNLRIAGQNKSSLFFPTFRRIEGGFSIKGRMKHSKMEHFNSSESLDTALSNLAATISVRQHKFVASISTNDVVTLLNDRYSEVLSGMNTAHSRFATEILSKIRDRATLNNSNPESLIQSIEQEANAVNKEREELFLPFTVLSDLVRRIFHAKGIRLSPNLTLGEQVEQIDSDSLSAGEKQMLSFLSYNAFSRDTSIFIDEPEISLHVDWQRAMFPILLNQRAGNQFIVATHSPFIYSKFADREVCLLDDKGDNGADTNTHF